MMGMKKTVIFFRDVMEQEVKSLNPFFPLAGGFCDIWAEPEPFLRFSLDVFVIFT